MSMTSETSVIAPWLMNLTSGIDQYATHTCAADLRSAAAAAAFSSSK